MRAAPYIRMSTDDQSGSPDRQKSLVLPHCERKGYTVVEVYEDLGLRGWDNTRPDFQRLLKDARKGRFDIIVVDEASRLSREDPLDFFATVAQPLRQAGVIVETVNDGRRHTWNSDDLGGMLLGFINQHTASQESVTLGRRTATGQAKRAKEGALYTGRAPYGLKYRLNAKGERIGYDYGEPEQVAVVQRIFDAYLSQDASIDSIVSDLNRERVAAPKGDRWGKNTINRILRNPVYAGRYAWGKVSQGRYYRSIGNEVTRTVVKSSECRPRREWIELPADHEPLVSPEHFEQVQSRLKANRSRTSKARKRGAYPLSGLLVCSHCGTPLYGTQIKSGGILHPAYRCGSNLSNGQCAPRQVRETAILGALVEALVAQFQSPVNRKRLEVALRDEEQQGDAERDEKARERKSAKIKRQIAEARRKLIHVPADMMGDAVAEIRRMERELDDLERPVSSVVKGLEALAANVGRLAETIQHADPETVRVLLRETVGRVDLRFDEVQKSRVKRYPLSEGTIHLQCVSSSHDGRAAGR